MPASDIVETAEPPRRSSGWRVPGWIGVTLVVDAAFFVANAHYALLDDNVAVVAAIWIGVLIAAAFGLYARRTRVIVKIGLFAGSLLLSLAAVLLLTVASVSVILTDPPPVLHGLPFEPRDAEVGDALLRAFPQGTPEEDMARALTAQGFTVDLKTRRATYRWPNLICATRLEITWVVSVDGHRVLAFADRTVLSCP
jgi:hypothetical protein